MKHMPFYMFFLLIFTACEVGVDSESADTSSNSGFGSDGYVAKVGNGADGDDGFPGEPSNGGTRAGKLYQDIVQSQLIPHPSISPLQASYYAQNAGVLLSETINTSLSSTIYQNLQFMFFPGIEPDFCNIQAPYSNTGHVIGVDQPYSKLTFMYKVKLLGINDVLLKEEVGVVLNQNIEEFSDVVNISLSGLADVKKINFQLSNIQSNYNCSDQQCTTQHLLTSNNCYSFVSSFKVIKHVSMR